MTSPEGPLLSPCVLTGAAAGAQAGDGAGQSDAGEETAGGGAERVEQLAPYGRHLLLTDGQRRKEQ